MKSEKIMALVTGVWEFCSYLFVPQWGRIVNKREYNDNGVKETEIIL